MTVKELEKELAEIREEQIKIMDDIQRVAQKIQDEQNLRIQITTKLEADFKERGNRLQKDMDFIKQRLRQHWDLLRPPRQEYQPQRREEDQRPRYYNPRYRQNQY